MSMESGGHTKLWERRHTWVEGVPLLGRGSALVRGKGTRRLEGAIL
jgi:hypothetical protein